MPTATTTITVVVAAAVVVVGGGSWGLGGPALVSVAVVVAG